MNVPFVVIAVLAYILNIADLAFTVDLVKKYGSEIEGNPLGKALFAHPWMVYFVKIVIVGALLALLCIFSKTVLSDIGILMCFIVYMAILIYHVIIVINIK